MEDLLTRMLAGMLTDPNVRLIDLAAVLFISQSAWRFVERKKQAKNGGTIETRVIAEIRGIRAELRKIRRWNHRVARLLRASRRDHIEYAKDLRELRERMEREL